MALFRDAPDCLGGWQYASDNCGFQDEFFHMDAVFLLKKSYYRQIDKLLPQILAMICDRVIVMVPAAFNGEHLKKNSLLLEDNSELLHYDLYLMNAASVSKPLCRTHYEGCGQQDILFDRDGRILEMLDAQKPIRQSVADPLTLIKKYWFCCQVAMKDYWRRDIFKLLHILQTLFQIHSDLLLVEYRTSQSGDWARRIRHNLSEGKQNCLKAYFCNAELTAIRDALLQCTRWFAVDARDICRRQGLEYPEELETLIKVYMNRYIKGNIF